jgi:acetate kinase
MMKSGGNTGGNTLIILVLNSGSSSIKFQLWDMAERKLLCKGLAERIGLDEGIFTYQPDGKEKVYREIPIPDHRIGIEMAIDSITDPEIGVINDIRDIVAVGHRIVHGGEKIRKSELITHEIRGMIEECIPLAPLHNPPNLMGIDAVTELLPGVPNVGVFDTAFHTTMPPHAYIYPLAYEYYSEHGIRRFGFHGTSHKYVSRRGAELLGIPVENFNCITCHLGNGISLAAVKGGKSVDTTLGYGTMCGIPMGTRAGDLDPAIILYLIDNLGMSTREVNNLIYKNSGLKGISGLTNDARDVVEAAENGHERAALALDIVAHHAKKYIAGMSAELDGQLDAIIFTAGIGENNPAMRKRICQGLEILGAEIDLTKNEVRGKETVISTEESRVPILVVPTNEELMIALDTEEILK